MTAKAIVFIALFTALAAFTGAFAAEKPAVDHRLPETILNRIAEIAGDQKCPSDKGRPLGSTHFMELGETSLLILLEIPDYLCDRSNTIVPLLADVRGRWILGDNLPGLPAFFGPGPDKALWLVTQWQVEGTYPSLLRSEDGLHWKELPLPAGPEPGSPFIFLSDLRFLGKDLLITLTSENGDENRPVQLYSANLREISSGSAAWQEYSDDGINIPAGCEPARRDESAWKREEAPEAQEVAFYSKDYRLVLPGRLSPPGQ